MPNALEILFDRSRHEHFEKCPRLRFLGYEYPATEHVEAETTPLYAITNGLTRQAHAVPLLTGSMVHKGIELFLTGFGEGGALAAALAAYDEETEKRGIEKDELAMEPQWTIKVQRALIEALVSGWIGFVYPRIEEEYEILEVEKEERASFPLPGTDVTMTLLARTDCLVRRKNDGALFVRNFKTMSEPSLRRLEAFRFDTQTISEVLAVEARLQDTAYENAVHARGGPSSVAPPTVQGVIYDILVKGPRKVEYPRGSGQWHNTSPLIWCYVKEGQTGVTDDQFAARWEWKCTEPHGEGRKACAGGAKHTLGPTWHRRLVTDVVPGGINGWFNWLQTHEPGLIDEQFQTLPAIMRTPFDIEVWKRTVLAEEFRIAQDAEICREVVAQSGYSAAMPTLDLLFPKHTHNGNCLFPTKCPMFDICWGTAGAALDEEGPEAVGYAPRQPNHPENIVAETDPAA